MFVIKDSGVAVLGGTKFSKPNHIRMAFACLSNDEIKKGCEALASSLKKLL